MRSLIDLVLCICSDAPLTTPNTYLPECQSPLTDLILSFNSLDIIFTFFKTQMRTYLFVFVYK